jgi:hypothetical protein
VLTLGLYAPYLLWRWSQDLHRATGGREFRPWTVIWTTIATLGFGTLYWQWKMARELVSTGFGRGVRIDPNLPTLVVLGTTLSVVVSLFSGGLAIVLGLVFAGWACWKLQDAMNSLAVETMSALPAADALPAMDFVAPPRPERVAVRE